MTTIDARPHTATEALAHPHVMSIDDIDVDVEHLVGQRAVILAKAFRDDLPVRGGQVITASAVDLIRHHGLPESSYSFSTVMQEASADGLTASIARLWHDVAKGGLTPVRIQRSNSWGAEYPPSAIVVDSWTNFLHGIRRFVAQSGPEEQLALIVQRNVVTPTRGRLATGDPAGVRTSIDRIEEHPTDQTPFVIGRWGRVTGPPATTATQRISRAQRRRLRQLGRDVTRLLDEPLVAEWGFDSAGFAWLLDVRPAA